MSSTPELSPSLSPTSENDDFPALLTSALPSPQQPVHVYFGSLQPEVYSDAHLIPEGEVYPYTQKLRYPTPLDSQISPSGYFTIPQFNADPSHPIATLTPIDIPVPGPEPGKDPHLCEGSGSPTAAINGQLSRTNHPSFIKLPDTLPVRGQVVDSHNLLTLTAAKQIAASWLAFTPPSLSSSRYGH